MAAEQKWKLWWKNFESQTNSKVQVEIFLKLANLKKIVLLLRNKILHEINATEEEKFMINF